MNDQEDATTETPDEAAAETPPVDPAAPAEPKRAPSMPAPPPWSYRAGGAPVIPGATPRTTPVTPQPVGRRPEGAPALPGPERPAVSSFGPVGRERSPFAVAMLSVLTLGVYALIWHDRVNAEMSDFDTRMRVRAASSTLAVIIPWLVGLVVTLAGAARVLVSVFSVHLPFDPHVTPMQGYYLLAGLGLVPYLVLLLPFSLLAVALTMERIRVVEDRVGVTADVQLQPTRLVWWLMVPVIGGLAMIAAMQRRLNRVWQLSAPRPSGIGA